MLTPVHLFILAQIIGESLPISSSSHLRILEQWVTMPTIPRAFDYFLHAPTLVIILVFFRREFSLLCALFYATPSSAARIGITALRMVSFAGITSTITVGFYLVFHIMLRSFLVSNLNALMLIGLISTMFSLFSLRYVPQQKKSTQPMLTVKHAVILGTLQGLVLLPGLSRFAHTYVGSRWLGYSWRRSFQISFLMQLPLIVLALVGRVVPGFMKNPAAWQLITMSNMWVMAAATVGGYAALLLAWKMAERGWLTHIAWYMGLPIAAAISLLGR